MLLSMTGFGEGRHQTDGLSVVAEVRTINSKYFKLTVKCAEGYGVLEGDIEAVVRRSIKRGTIQIALRIDRTNPIEQHRINLSVLAGYREQLEVLYDQWHVPEAVPLERLLLLPGVVDEGSGRAVDAEAVWPAIKTSLEGALDNLNQMRREEGAAMAADLHANCQTVAHELSAIEQRAPLVAANYRGRLAERLQKTLAEYQISLDPADIIKEVSLFAERSDISEETVRLRSHLDQFDAIAAEPESAGRKLEFLTQEMFRETNTIGSKANDVEISRHTIEIKAAIERIREMIQNVE